MLTIERIEQIMNELSQLSTGNICDANNKLGSMYSRIKPINASLKMVGIAFTINGRGGDNLGLHQAIAKAQRNTVLVANLQYEAKGHFGEIMATACMVRGIRGVVIDGGCRDFAALQKLNFPVYSSSINPSGTTKQFLVPLNTPIDCGGVRVNPGDFIIGDADGVVVVAKENVEEVLVNAQEIAARETEVFKSLAEGKTTLEIYNF